MKNKNIAAAISVLLFVGLGIFAFRLSKPVEQTNQKVVRVLSYSSFLATWGPAQDLAKIFEEKTGIKVEYHDADDAGLLLSKLELFPSDVVLGLDSLTAHEARKTKKWKEHRVKQQLGFTDKEFLAFDWAPLTFVYRDGEVEPPKSLDDLLDSRFQGQISLQDPRTSAPGLLFFFWLIADKGESEALEFLKKLKPNIRAVSLSWSSAYGLFQKDQAKLVFSYLTSPVYHWVKENDQRYKPAELSGEHIFQVEFAAIPADCKSCEEAHQFLEFLVSLEAQKIIMEKNVMLPVRQEVMAETDFAKLPEVELLDLSKFEGSLDRKKELLDKWRELNL